MITKRNKALSVSPLKASQPMGAALAFLGMYHTMPMLHGSQGCTAFGKVFFVRHFREPIPLQTTALDQVGAIMNPDDNVMEGLKVIAEKNKPAMIGLITTGLSETEGTDVKRTVREFRQQYPQFDNIAVVPVNTPDYKGCLETGYSLAIQAMIEELVPDSSEAPKVAQRQRQVNVLISPSLTPSDVEVLKETIEAFNLRPVMIPDLADSMDGHLTESRLNPLTIGGLAVSEFETLGLAAATIVIGASMDKAADMLHEKTTVPDYRFKTLMTMEAFDQFLMTLKELSGAEIPDRFERQRSQLQDAMLDTHFMLGQLRVAIAADPDELYNFNQLFKSMGAEIVTAIAPTHVHTGILEQLDVPEVQIGDLEDLEKSATEQKAQLLIGNSHVVESAKRLELPILRASFPQYDYVGGYQRTWIGYKGCRQTLFDLANLVLHSPSEHEIEPYYAKYTQKEEYEHESEQTLTRGVQH
ncbi:nitrogenase iron-molybdenum cofactor biosynthesis protein NifN [Candidatus Albibeggiatoa sp. nov. NOAA]|uniref:nitrogenase iron-molybdenum cofactor biosynthesis protein NifN n=1 Tax=Candidatus Albibeggiatoa sp. nov. NOAA TaxID=3162724 RepID=UPI0032FBF805|nr:nitrogenase iron-molybdenum cofactor biosynthesis protein NifN [Thiotrichaceae bacterium]